MKSNIKVSSTRISSFLACKQKYWFNYYSKMPKVSNPSFKLGTAVHESLELAGNIWKEKEKFSKEDVNKILEKYDNVSVSEGIEDYEVHAEGRELVSKRVKSFLTGRKIIGLEIKFGFWGPDSGNDITSELGVPVMGAIDKVEELSEDTIIIIDYKTSKTAPTSSQMRNDVQLSLYDMVARKMYPQYKRVILALDLLKSEMLYTYRTNEQRQAFEYYLKAVYDQMLTLREEDVKASLNMFCPWCDFKDYCSTYQSACKKSDYTFLPTMQYDNDRLISEWEMVKSVKKILESRERELGMVMMEKIKANAANMKGDDKEIYVKQNSSTNYSLDTVYKSVPPDDFSSLVSLNKKAVETYMSMNPSIKEMIADTATTNYTSPFLASRKLKK
jgi:CRISPR/Cas system-associated exonuclease Cas4 (RecB family)